MAALERHSHEGGNLESLITDNFDVWTAAIQKKSAAGRGSKKKISLHGIKKLRELILELAVRGKLVPQDASDEPVEALLRNIERQRNELIKNKEIKKTKTFPKIKSSEHPFILPTNWEWVRLNDLGEWGAGATPRRDNPSLYGGVIPWFKSGELNSYYISKSEETVTELALSQSSLRFNKKGDVLIAMYGATIGKTAILSVPATTNQAVCACTPFTGFSNVFLLTLLRAYRHGFVAMGAGGAQPNISREKLIATIIALPPVNEQKRIVTKVNELMALCDQLEQQTENSITAHQTLVETVLSSLTQSSNAKELQQNWARIETHFDTLFTTENSIDQLKQTILQLAVMGKLVPQNQNDEPASELLKKIAVEKEQLIKDKKIKKQKPLPEIGEDEKPFDLPVGWEWCRIGAFSLVGTGATPSRTNLEYSSPAEINWVTSGETANEFISETKEKISKIAIEKTNVSVYPVGTLIIAMYGQGKTRGQITELKIQAGTNQACAAIQLLNDSESHRAYVKLYFKKAYEELRGHASGGAQPNLNVGKVSLTVLPIPPLKEQRRIVEKVYSLINTCDDLKIYLNRERVLQTNLANSVTEEAVN